MVAYSKEREGVFNNYFKDHVGKCLTEKDFTRHNYITIVINTVYNDAYFYHIYTLTIIVCTRKYLIDIDYDSV